MFDGIDDKDVEANIETAENTIQTSIDRGILSKTDFSKLPNLRDGLALSFAAANKGNSRAATRAREAAYMEDIKPLVDKVKNGLSYELPKMENAVLKTNEKLGVETLLNKAVNTNPVQNSEKFSERTLPSDSGDVRLKAITQNQTGRSGIQNSDVGASKTEYHKSFFAKEFLGENNNVHRLLPSTIKSIDELKLSKNNEKFSYTTQEGIKITPSKSVIKYFEDFFSDNYNAGEKTFELVLDNAQLELLHKYLSDGVKNAERPNNIGKGLWAKQVENDLKWIDDVFGNSSKFAKALKTLPAITIGIDMARGIKENIENKSGKQEIISDAIIDVGFGVGNAAVSAKIGGAIGTAVAPGVGTIAGIVMGILIGYATEEVDINGKSAKEWADTFADWAIDGIKKWFA